MTALPGPLSPLAASMSTGPQLTGPAIPVLLALTFAPAEAAALLAQTGVDDVADERPGEMYRDLAETWAAGDGRAPGRPIWQSLAFIDLFADAAGGARAALLASDGPPRGLSALTASMKFVTRLLRALRQEAATAAAADTTFLSGHDAVRAKASPRR